MVVGMDKKDWLKIQKNWEYLKKEVDALNLLDILRCCPDEILTHEDEQRVRYEFVDADKVEKLLKIIKCKPSQLHAYKWFIGSLKKLGQDHVAAKLVKTEINPDEMKEEPGLDIKGMVRELLLKNFADEEGKMVALPEVRRAVSVLKGRCVNFDWKDRDLKDFVIEVFTGVLYEQGEGKKRVPRFLNLGARELTTIVPRVCSLPEQVLSHAPGASAIPSEEPASVETVDRKHKVSCLEDIESMTTVELCAFLTPIFQKLDIKEEFSSKFKQLEIDGFVFLTMKEQDFKVEFTPEELSFGKRRKLMLEITSLLEEIKQGKTVESIPSSPESGTFEFQLLSATVAEGGQVPGIASEEPVIASDGYKEYFRKFDSPVAPTDKYTRGRTMELSGFSRENMINPVKRFLTFDKGDDIYRKIAKETVMFASACMNDRKNGTLYVGINPDNTSEVQLGQVVGVHLDKQKCEDIIRQFIGETFYEDQQEVAFQSIRSAKFIEVLNSESSNTWVIEVDVVPLGEMVKSEAFFLRGRQLGGHKNKKKEELYRLVDGTLQALSEKEIYEFMKKKKDLTELRLQQEFRSSDAYVQPDLRKQILNLFTGGSETVEDEIYPVLMTSPLDSHMNEEYIKENLSFIQYFDAKAVFDFDPNVDARGLFDFFENKDQLYEVHTTDNFDITSESYSEKNFESLKMSTERSWVFCNGYSPLDKEKMEPFDWKQNRSDGFKEALRFFHSSIPLGRGIVLIFLFSKNYEVLLEAANEVIPTFKNQWMVIAETEEIANLWKDEMVRRNVVSKKSMDNRCVLGMPWRHVNATFTQIISPRQTLVCELPTSSGAFCTLKERDKLDMNNLEILGRNECDGNEELQDSQSKETLRRRAEETFFRGGQVQWLNFWFGPDHVLKRKQHNDIMERVKKSLETSGPDDDERVSIVTLMHQPGSGGSTSSRQILWDLKDKSRCCVVKQISDETATQITKLRNYDEKTTRKPPLVLVDNEDEEKVYQLILQLEEKAKYASRNEEHFKVFCTVLHCMRRVNLPKSQEGDKFLLKHELQPWELTWFQRKYETLERKFNEDKKVDPKLLISFNILKTNFDAGYIKRTVTEFMKEIDDTKESLLLRYLSLVNSFDIDFQTIPISAFDPIIGHQSKQKRILQFGILEKSGSRGKGWEATMSTSVRVLVNESSQRGAHGTHIRTIRITSTLLAREILSYIVMTSKQQISEIMVEFLSSAIFDCENSSTFKLLSIIKNLVKKRQKQKEGRRLAKFSPLILDIMDKEGADKAAEICEDIHRKTEDTMIAQQIARFYIHTKNWSRAEKYARICTQNLPKNSFLWDTYGQVYKQQLVEHYNRAKTGVKISDDDASEILLLAQKAIDTFRKEQVLSETEKSFINNHGGYLGELRVTMLLINTICHFESYIDVEELHKFLVDESYKPPSFSFLDRHEEEMLKSLGESAFKAIRRLEDEFVHLKGDSREELRTEWAFDKRTLVMLKENVNTFFGEDSDDVPASLSIEDACEYRRRRVRRMGLTSLQGALALKYEENGEEKLKTVYSLIIQNVKAECCTAFDLVTILNTVIALHVARSMVEKIDYSKILEWSSKLYAAKQPEDRPYLETFLYLVLFHLPTESRRLQGFRLCSEVKIQEALAKWKEAFFISYPKQRDTERLARRKDTTLFFLGKGVGLKEVVYQKELLSPGERMRDDEFWQSERAKKRFQRLEGTLLVGGCEVQVQLQLPGGNKFHITIPTSLPTMKRSMWQKRVFFVLGFSWSGPKAYDITLNNPSNGYHEQNEGGTLFPKPSIQRGYDVSTLKLTDIETEMIQVKRDVEILEKKESRLSKNEKKKMASLERKLVELTNAKSELLGVDDTD